VEEVVLTLATIQQAYERIRPHVHRTPVLTSRRLDALVGCRVYLKAEGFQRGGSFKVRGATNAAMLLSPEEKARGLIAYSSGNHAQGVALAAQTVGSHALVVMPEDAPRPKREAVLAYGAQIHPYDRRLQSREEIARELAQRTGRILIPPFDDERIIAGQGTVALELVDQVPALDHLLVPVGGGGLVSGCATVVAERWPLCRVWGVEPETADDARRSLEAGRIVEIPEPETIADGLRPRCVGRKTFPIMKGLLAGILTVPDRAIARATLFLMEAAKIVVEPSGAVGFAALMEGRVPEAEGTRVGVVLSGANLDPAIIPRLRELAGSQVP
jgi:threonine dehydratase